MVVFSVGRQARLELGRERLGLSGAQRGGDTSEMAVLGGELLSVRGGIGGCAALMKPDHLRIAKHGVYPPRSIEGRAADLEMIMLDAATVTPSQLLGVREVARLTAIIEAIDRHLGEHGLLNKKGEANSLLSHRIRISRQLERWISRISSPLDRESSQPRIPATEEELEHELERIALGKDADATSRDRIYAYKAIRNASPGLDPGFVPRGSANPWL